MKRKSVLLGTKKIHYPAAGLQSDVEALLQKFVDTNSIRYEEFARLWRESNFSLIHAGRAGLREKRYFVEEAFKTIIKFIQSPFSLQVRVGALYTLYGIYHTQRMSPKVRVRVPLSCWQEVSEMHEEVRAHKHLDVDYIIRKMKHDGVFEFVAYPSSLTLEHLYNCDDDDGDDSAAVVDYNWQSEPSALTALLDEESLGQLSAVHDKYHQLKCDLNHRRGGEANTPSSSLDLIHSDVVETIVRIGREKEAVLTSPVRGKNKQPPRSAPSDDSARERANRIREIKQRASSARANTDSSSLRYINTSPPGASQDFSSTSSQRGVRKRAKATRRPGANRRSADGSESEDSLVEELDVRAISPKKNKLPSRSSKKQARQKLSKSIADYVSSDDEDPADFSDDDYDVTSDLIPKESARLGRASSARKRRKLSSQNDEPEAGPSSISEDKPTAEIVAISTVDDGLEDGGGKKVDDSKGNKGAKAKARKSREGDAPQEVADVLPRKRAGTASKWPLPLVEAASSSSQVRESPMRQKLRKQRESRSIGPTMSNAKGEPIFKLEADSYVALKPTKTERQRPAVAKVVSATDTHVVVIRYTGMYYSVWREKDENTPPEKETLHRNHVLFGDFDLTRKGMLPTKVVRILHALYAEFDE